MWVLTRPPIRCISAIWWRGPLAPARFAIGVQGLAEAAVEVCEVRLVGGRRRRPRAPQVQRGDEDPPLGAAGERREGEDLLDRRVADGRAPERTLQPDLMLAFRYQDPDLLLCPEESGCRRIYRSNRNT